MSKMEGGFRLRKKNEIKQPSKHPEAVENVGSIKPVAGRSANLSQSVPSTNNIIEMKFY